MKRLLPTIFGISLAIHAQGTSSLVAPAPSLSVVLEPGPSVDGIPAFFTFHLRNIGREPLHVPAPYIDCRNKTAKGSVWLNESWQPSTGDGLAKGFGVCDFGGTTQPPPPITKVAAEWPVLKPGESLYIHATQADLHFDASQPGSYTFSALYLPPGLSKEQLTALQQAGIAVPQAEATSAPLHYDKPSPR